MHVIRGRHSASGRSHSLVSRQAHSRRNSCLHDRSRSYVASLASTSRSDTLTLRPLLPSIARDRDLRPAVQGPCPYCGMPTNGRSFNGSCVQCHLVLNLDRPSIDDEAILSWVPEISQAALNIIVRELHCQLHARRTSFVSRPGAHFVTRIFNDRARVANDVLGTSRPSELAQSLSLMRPASYTERHRLLGGIRVLAVGRFFVEQEDIYPEILDEWCGSPTKKGDI